jgi:hypothetical protein
MKSMQTLRRVNQWVDENVSLTVAASWVIFLGLVLYLQLRNQRHNPYIDPLATMIMLAPYAVGSIFATLILARIKTRARNTARKPD